MSQLLLSAALDFKLVQERMCLFVSVVMQHSVTNMPVPFGGFESCETGNPFVLKSVSNMNSPENYPHSCPFVYTKYPIIFDDGCWINAYACFSIQPVVFKHCYHPSTNIQTLLVQ